MDISAELVMLWCWIM